MLAFQWLNRFVTQCRLHARSRLHGGSVGRPATTGEAMSRSERRLKLMRLEQRRVLNADFTFVAQSNLTLSHIDGDLAVREVGDRIEFDLAGSTWNHLGGNGTFSIDNSQVNRSILSIDRSELSGLNAGFSISADPNGTHHLTFETQNAAIDLQMAAGPLAIRDFEDVRQVGSHDLLVQDFSVAARNTIELLNLRGDDLTLSAAEIDFNGGQHSIAGSSLSIATGSGSSIELGGSVDHANVLDFTSADIGALAGGFQSLSFSAHGGYLSGDSFSGDGANGSIIVLSSGADVREALTPAAHANHQSANQADVGHLLLSADCIRIDGELTNAGGVIEVSATHDVTISHRGGIVNQGGEILVDAGVNGTLLVAGHLDASSVSSHESDSGDGIGGRIHLLGEQVGLFGGARVDASGDNGGGEVLIGGDLHGGNEAIHHALRTYVGSDVEINADARLHGDGGKVVVWSDEVSQVYGLLTARGGAWSGDGGLIETSSRSQLLLNGGGDASAANGDPGTWLIDPLNVGIVDQLTLFPTIIEFNELPDFVPSVSGSEVTDDAIEAQLNMGTNVVITTENLYYSEAGNVTQAADATIDVTFIADGDSATLTIIAANDIELNGGITASNGALSVVLNANAITNNDDLNRVSGSVTLTAALDLNGGSFESTGVNFDSTSIAIMAAGGVTITHTGGIDLGQIYSGTGTGGTLLLSGATAQGEVSVGEGDIAINGGNADTVVFGDVSATASVIISANRDVLIREAKVTVTGPMSDLTITADADSDGSGGFWLDEGTSAEDAQLIASHNITIIGSDLHAPTDRNGGVRIDGDDANQQVIAGNDLTLLSNFDAASTTGDIVIEGVQVATSGSLTVFAKSQIFLGADQTAGNDVLFKSAVKLTNDVVITADNDVTFDSTVDESTDAISSALTVTTSSPGAGVLFVGAIGADDTNGGPIDSLNVNGVGFVDFLNTVAIDGDINVTTTSSVDIVTFQNRVTTTSGSVTITNAGLLVTSSEAAFDLAGSFIQNGTGWTELGADITTAGGDISFAQAVLLASTREESVTVKINSGGGNITFSSTIDSNVVPLALLDGVLVPISQVGGEVVDVRPEHNSLELTAGSGTIRFDGDIGAGFLDVGVPSDGNQMLGVGADGDQMLGALIVKSAGKIEIGAVSMIAVDGEIDFGSANEITGGIEITGLSDPGTITIQSRFGEIHGDIHRNDSRSIIINGPVTTQVDLVILAADGVTLTDAADITTNDHNIVINGDTNQDMAGDLVMGPETLIDAGSGYIDLSANNVLLGALESTNSNSTYADHPAIRVEATTGSINDGNDPLNDDTHSGKNITAKTPGSGVVLIAVTGIGSGDALETDLASLSAYNHDIVEEQQTITLENVIGGTFTISWQPPGSLPEETTQPIRFNATATEIRDALLSIDLLPDDGDSLSADDIDVISVGGGQFVLKFSGAYRGVDVNDILVSDTDLIGASDKATLGAEATGVSTTTTPLKAAEGNIEIVDVRAPIAPPVVPPDVPPAARVVHLIFAHNEANQTEQQFASASQSFDGTFPPAIPNNPPPPPVDVQFEFFAVKPGPESNDIVINFTASPHTGMTLGLPVITVTGHTIDIDLDSNGTAANTLRNAINTNEQANVLIHARIISSADTVASNIAGSANGVSIDLGDVGSQTGVIDINIEHGDLTVVDDKSQPLYLDMREGIDSDAFISHGAQSVLLVPNLSLTLTGLQTLKPNGEVDPLVFDNDVLINVEYAALGSNGEPSVEVNERTITLVLDTATHTTAKQVVDAIKNTPDAAALVRASVSAGDLMKDVVGDDPHSESVTINVDSAFNIRFVGVNLGPFDKDPVVVVETATDTPDNLPVVLVSERVITLTLNTTHQTTAGQVIDAINQSDEAKQLVRAELTSGSRLADITAVIPEHSAIALAGDRAIAAVQSENTIRLTANTITILDDLLAIQDSATNDPTLGERIEIYARNNFVLGDDRVITTDQNYVSSISEDQNGNGELDPTEDVNGNGELDYNRNSKPETFADDPNRDQITIIADSDYEAGGPRAGSVLLGTNSTISTDSGIEQQISPRPVLTPNALQPFLYKSDTAFFSGEVIVSNLDTNGELDGKPLYIGSLTFTIGVAGEKNLVLDIDWGDLTPAYRDNLVYPTQLADGSFRFDRVTDRTATRFLIPEGGHTYVIPHEYTQNALNLKTNEGVDTDQPGRNLTSDPLQVRFAVSHHSSIRIEGQSVLNPDGTTEDVPKNHPYPLDKDGNPVKTEPIMLKHEGRYLLSSTDVSDDPTAFLPRFDNGIAAFTIPTSKAVSVFIPPDPVIVPIETPKLVTTETVVVPPAQLTTETTVVSSSSMTVTTTEYFELRRFGDDGTVEIERLNDFQGDGLLDKERFEKFISDKGDGEYEIWFITRENSSGTMIERPVIHFRLEGGHLAPPPNDSPLLFKPFKLIPLPAVPKPANDAGEAAGDSDGAEEGDQSPKIEIQEENSSDSTRSSDLSTSFNNLSATGDTSDGIEFSSLDSVVQPTASLESSWASAASLAAGVLVFAGTQRWTRRSKEAASSSFSRSARLARKLAE